MYDMLGNHGSRYELRVDPKARKSINADDYKTFSYNEQVFGHNGKFTLFEPLLRKCIAEEIFTKEPNETLLTDITKNSQFNNVLMHTWETFYKEHWNESKEELTKLVSEIASELPWNDYVKDMEKFAGKSFTQPVYIFPTRAAAESALVVEPSVIIGNAYHNYDFGFVHEGLHILLGEQWAEQPELLERMKDFNEVGGWGKNWKGKYEQALVVALDSVIKKHPETFIQKYFAGCNVGDLYEAFWPHIKKVTEEGMTVESFMNDRLTK
jgi:hypothetical protein